MVHTHRIPTAKGGRDIQRECHKYVEQHGRLNPGQVYVSTAGRLPLQKVIHAVGPRWEGGSNNEENTLRGAVFESMLAAERCGLSSIALPALSSGASGFPIDRCTEVSITTLKDFLESHNQTCVKKVSLVDPAERVVSAFNTSLDIVLGKSQGKKEKQNIHADNTGSRSGGSTGRSYVFGGSTVEVVRGDLTRFRADAIVNAANGRLNHIAGLAKDIVNAGGPEIQRECDNHVHRHGSLWPGQIYVSTPGRLPCKKVIHAVIPRWQGGSNNAKKQLRGAVLKSMWAAEWYGLSSIALPALSSGASGFPIDICTKVIITALKDFLESHKQICVKKVSLLDPSHHVVNAFHKSLGMQQVVTSDHGHSASLTDLGSITRGARPKQFVDPPHSQPSTIEVKMTAPPPCASAQPSREATNEQEQQGAVGGTSKHCNIINDKSNHIGSLMNNSVEKDVKKGQTYRDTSKSTDKPGGQPSAQEYGRLDDTILPKLWSEMGSDESWTSVKLGENSNEYKTIQKKFTKHVEKSARVIYNITRIQNPKLYRQYVLRRKQIKKHCDKQAAKECTLWRKTTADAVDDTNANGFRDSGRKATPFGDAIRFSVKPSPQKRAKGMKYVYLARVVTGEYAVSNEDDPAAHQTHGVPVSKFDSLFDSSANTYGVFSSDQAYPEHLVEFR